jgi:hypothetical protein
MVSPGYLRTRTLTPLDLLSCCKDINTEETLPGPYTLTWLVTRPCTMTLKDLLIPYARPQEPLHF